MPNSITDDEYYSDVNTYTGVTASQSEKTKELESKGWEHWLLTCFPFAFEEDFSDDHRKFWDLRWSVLMRIREQKKYIALGMPVPPQFHIADKEFVVLLVLGRGLAKSSTIEASAVMRGAILGGGYCLYVCEAADQANEHIGNIKGLITNEESRVAEFYPEMWIDENATINGTKTRDREDLFITANGLIVRAKGLNSRLRGLRIGNKRPDDIKIDDIDGVNDSVAVSIKKIKQLTSSVIPTQARRHAIIDFGQNLIAENGVMTQIHTGASDAFAERTTIGVTNTFEEFREGVEYQTYLDEADGRIRHKILDTAIPTWAGVDTHQAQKFLNDSGLETFIAEYMNSFAHQQTEKVFSEYTEARHLITWEQFQTLFGTDYIPAHWKAKASADLGYSSESISAWVFTAASAKNSALPNHYFVYRTLTFEGAHNSIDDQAVKIWEEMFPENRPNGRAHFEATQSFTEYPELFRLLDTKPRCKSLLANYRYNAKTNAYEDKRILPAAAHQSLETQANFYLKQAEKTFRSQIGSWWISHEKTGEQKTLAQKYGLPVNKTRHFKAKDGITEANHLLRGDYTRPHPFYSDEMILDSDEQPTGLYRLGCPFIFVVCATNQIKAPKDDLGHKTFRDHIGSQRWTKVKVTETGLTETVPMKIKSDMGDAFRMFAADYIMPESTELTQQERIVAAVAEVAPEAVIGGMNDVITPEMQMQIQETQSIALRKIKEEDGELDDEEVDDLDKYLGNDSEISW